MKGGLRVSQSLNLELGSHGGDMVLCLNETDSGALTSMMSCDGDIRRHSIKQYMAMQALVCQRLVLDIPYDCH